MTDNLSALKSFDPFKSGFDENTIINASAGKSGDDSISVTAKGRYKIFSSWSRTPAQKADNNATRTQLLAALGQALNMEGVHKEQGRITFSADFLTKLEEKLGKDVLKTGDFKLDNQGNVVSGKPLTARRVRQIMDKTLSMVSIAPETIDYDKYENKLKNITDKYQGNPRISKNLEFVSNCLTALKNCAENGETIIMKNMNLEKYPDIHFVFRDGNKLKPMTESLDYTDFFKKTTGFRSDLAGEKFTKFLRVRYYDPSKLEKEINKMVNKYHGGVKPPEYDFRDDMIRELNDKLIKYVKLTVDLFEKCAEKGKPEEFDKVMCTDFMGNNYPVKYKITQLEGLQRNLLQA